MIKELNKVSDENKETEMEVERLEKENREIIEMM